MSEPEIELVTISKTYGRNLRAVDNVSLDVHRGECLALLGPSGCGKTTLLRMIAGFVQPSAGEIRIQGRNVVSTPAHRRNTAMVFQNYALFPHLTVRRNIAFGLEMRRVSANDVARRVTRAMALVRLEGLDARYPRQLSGGQQQRVALARALVTEPLVLLLDEPLSNLDARLRQEMREEIRIVQRQLGMTTIFVTHDQEEALSMADRVVVMNAGHIEQIGSPGDVYARPATRFVARFISDANILTGTVIGVEDERVWLSHASGVRFAGCGQGLVEGHVGHLVIRPESVRLLAAAEQAASPDAVIGTVQGVTYLGSRILVRANSPVGELRMVGDARTLAGLTSGSAVRLGWSPDEVVIVGT